MTQKSYFDGTYVGCDESTGLGLPDWELVFAAYGIRVTTIESNSKFTPEILELMTDPYPRAFLVPIHPEQTYYPKITSKVITDGKMESNPLHLMTPELPTNVAELVYRYLKV